ncbi:hypothetical protein L600_000100001760 [Isoptericola variabilis J7]|uniref:DUF8129 domain-containing protein n=2 Tax=Isoptericola TaxID=254250 RepID=F6FU41_ISOV2|nr:hypothetical protein Isova_0440 [Isoptericola variabilis 225]TWH35172.1 hypothetical protein L600_000100001760 [Isoptericola variabilis J7]
MRGPGGLPTVEEHGADGAFPSERTTMTDDRTNETTRDELPLPDYDHLPVGTLAHRIRSLDADALGKVLAYERAHGDRMPVVTVLEQRLEELRGGAEPSGGDAGGPTPQQAPPSGGSKASPQTAAEPGGPEWFAGNSSQPRG